MTDKFSDRTGRGVRYELFVSFCKQRGYTATRGRSADEFAQQGGSRQNVRAIVSRFNEVFDRARDVGQIDDFRHQFERHDVRGAGIISRRDFISALESMQVKDVYNVRRRDIESICEEYSAIGDTSSIEYSRFLRDAGARSGNSSSGGGASAEKVLRKIQRELRRERFSGEDYEHVFEGMIGPEAGSLVLVTLHWALKI